MLSLNKDLTAEQIKYDPRRDALCLLYTALAGIALLALLANVMFLPFRASVFVPLFVCIILSVIMIVALPKIKNIRLVSVLSVAYMEFLLIPAFIVTGMDTSNMTPLFVCAALFSMFYILKFRDRWWLFVLCGAFDIAIYIFVYVWEPDSFITEEPSNYFMGFASAFGIVCVTIIAIYLIQDRNFKRAKELIEKSHDVEKNADAAKTRFLSNMSQEIRTPMNSIIGLSELVLKDEMDDVTRNEVSVIKQSAYELLDVIDDVFMYSKIDSGELKLVNTDFRFDELLKQVLQSVSAATKKKDLKIRIKIDHNIPKIVNGDDITIKQVFLRLIFLSISLTENGRLMLTVKAERDEKDEMVHFVCSVSDTGCGLSSNDIRVIDGDFAVYDSRQNSNFKGIGLKFSICKELLNMMNGTLELKSIEGVGLESEFTFDCKIANPEPMIRVEGGSKRSVLIYTNDDRELTTWKSIMEGFKIRPDYVNSYFSFDRAIHNTKYDYIFIPNTLYATVSNIISMYHCEDDTYVIADSTQSFGDFDKCRIIRHPVSCLSVVDVLNNNWKAEDYVSKNDDTHIDCSAAKILVVDDNSVNLKVAQGIFKSFNTEIDTAKSGQEALDKMNNVAYDLVLMDMVMPEMSGEETLKRMRDSGIKSMLDVPVIALTATTGGNVREEILDMGFQEYLAKPIKQRYLTKCLLTFLPPEMINRNGGGSTGNTATERRSAEKMDLTSELNVLDTRKGIESVGEDEEEYCKILNTFFEEGNKILENLPVYIETGKIDSFVTETHGIKASSASIGAMTVSQMFRELETAGKEKNVEFINKYYDAYSKALMKILDDVKGYLLSKGKFNDPSINEKKANETLVEEKLTRVTVGNLKEAIERMDLAAIDSQVKNLIGRNYGTKVSSCIERLSRAYEVFDFYNMKLALSELIKSVDN